MDPVSVQAQGKLSSRALSILLAQALLPMVSTLDLTKAYIRIEQDIDQSCLVKQMLQDPNCPLETLILPLISYAQDDVAKKIKNILEGVGGNAKLKLLDLSGSDLKDANTMETFACLANTGCELNQLILRDCSLTDKGLTALIKSLEHNTTITHLDISGHDFNQKITVKGIQDLITAIKRQKLPNLQTITLPTGMPVQQQNINIALQRKPIITDKPRGSFFGKMLFFSKSSFRVPNRELRLSVPNTNILELSLPADNKDQRRHSASPARPRAGGSSS